jgi:hypothetical protein
MTGRSPRANIAFAAVIAAVLVVVGCLSTWATVRGVSFSGTDANAGKSTLIAAVIAALLILIATRTGWRWLSIIATIPAAIAAAISSYRLADIANFVQGAPGADASWGIWLTVISAIVLFLLCLAHAIVRSATLAETPAETEDTTSA